MKRFIPIAATIIIVIGFGIWYFFVKAKPLEFESTTVLKESIVATVQASGKIDSTEIVELSFATNGKVTWIGAKVGDAVHKNQAIASLDKRDLGFTLAQKEASLHSAQSDLDKVLDDIRLFKLSNPNITETQTQKNLRERAESLRDAAFQAVQATKKTMDDNVVLTPIDGTLISQNAKVGQNIQGFLPVAKVANLAKVNFIADVDQSDIAKVAVGQKAIVSLDTFPAREVEGKITLIHPETSTTPTGAVIVKVEIKLDNIDFPVQLGLTGDAEIETDKREKTLTLPILAIAEVDRKQFVFAVDEKWVTHKKEIKTGLVTEEKIEIVAGIAENDVILTSDLDKVSNGQKVKLAR